MAKTLLKKTPQQRVEKATENIAVESIEMVDTLMKQLNQEMKKLDIPEEILDRDIKAFGNASHIILPEKYKGKKAKVIIKK